MQKETPPFSLLWYTTRSTKHTHSFVRYSYFLAYTVLPLLIAFTRSGFSAPLSLFLFCPSTPGVSAAPACEASCKTRSFRRAADTEGETWAAGVMGEWVGNKGRGLGVLGS